MKRVFLFGVIFYSIALLLMQDWPSMTQTTGAQSAPFLVLMVVDIVFAGIAAIKLVGPAFLEDEGEEVSLHAEDVEVPDHWFYGLFALNLGAHLGWHGYESVMATGAYSLYASIWFLVECAALFLTFIFYKHAVKAARRTSRPTTPPMRRVG